MKKILKEGEGYERPNEGAAVCMNYDKCLWSFCDPLDFTFVSYKFLFKWTVKLIGKLQDSTIFVKKRP